MASNPPNTDPRVISATTDRLFETVEGLLGRPLNAAERLSFTTRLASINTSAVAPGDLISADLFNALRADINDLAVRLALVEDSIRSTASPPLISRIEPAGLRSGGGDDRLWSQPHCSSTDPDHGGRDRCADRQDHLRWRHGVGVSLSRHSRLVCHGYPSAGAHRQWCG